MVDTSAKSPDGGHYRPTPEAKRCAKSIVRYFGGARHFASITGVTYQTVYNYVNGLYHFAEPRRKTLMQYVNRMGLDFQESDFDDPTRIEDIMSRSYSVQCVLCLDEPCTSPVDYRKVPWFMGEPRD